MNVKTTDIQECIKGLKKSIEGLNHANNYIYAHDKTGHKKIKNIMNLIWKLEGQLKD